MSNLRAPTVLRGLVNNLAIDKRLKGPSGTVANEHVHRKLNAIVPQDSTTGLDAKLAGIAVAVHQYNCACSALTPLTPHTCACGMNTVLLRSSCTPLSWIVPCQYMGPRVCSPKSCLGSRAPSRLPAGYGAICRRRRRSSGAPP